MQSGFMRYVESVVSTALIA